MRTGLLALLVVALLLGNAWALEASQVKRALDRGGNWLIEQYDAKEKVFGKGEQAKDVVTVAMCVKALCDNPRDYKETSGPFISEPVKYILSQIGEDGKLKGQYSKEVNAYLRVLQALKATQNETYSPILTRCEAAGRALVTEDQWKLLCVLTERGLAPFSMEPDPKKRREEAETSASGGLEMQRKNGCFSDDIQAHALALNTLNLCYKAMK